MANRRWYHDLVQGLLGIPTALAVVLLSPFIYIGQMIAITVITIATGRDEDSAQKLLHKHRIWLLWILIGASFWIGLGLLLLLG